jgi:integrase
MPKLTKRFIEAVQPVPDREVVKFDDELHGFGIRVWPSAKRVYFVKYRTRDGRQRKLTIGTHGIITAEQARATARRCLADASQGEDPAATRKAQREAPTMAQLAERYLVEHARPHKKPSSVANDERLLAKKVLPELGPLKAHAVTRADVARLHRSFQATPFEANRLLALLSRMFTLAEEWHVRPQRTNPCRGLKRFNESRRQLFLSELQLGRLGRALSEAERDRSEPPAALMAVSLLLYTGCRLSEILTLRWEEVDLERGYLRLSDSKTGRKDVPLNGPAIAILAEAKRDPENPYVIPGRKRGTHLVNLELAWRRIRARAGLEGIRLHDLRHTFASAGASNGVSLPLLGALLGHTQPATTSRYAHCAADPVRQANELVGRYLSSALGMKLEEQTATAGLDTDGGQQ